jgi:hypothetical protein
MWRFLNYYPALKCNTYLTNVQDSKSASFLSLGTAQAAPILIGID